MPNLDVVSLFANLSLIYVLESHLIQQVALLACQVLVEIILFLVPTKNLYFSLRKAEFTERKKSSIKIAFTRK